MRFRPRSLAGFLLTSTFYRNKKKDERNQFIISQTISTKLDSSPVMTSFVPVSLRVPAGEMVDKMLGLPVSESVSES